MDSVPEVLLNSGTDVSLEPAPHVPLYSVTEVLLNYIPDVSLHSAPDSVLPCPFFPWTLHIYVLGAHPWPLNSRSIPGHLYWEHRDRGFFVLSCSLCSAQASKTPLPVFPLIVPDYTSASPHGPVPHLDSPAITDYTYTLPDSIYTLLVFVSLSGLAVVYMFSCKLPFAF